MIPRSITRVAKITAPCSIIIEFDFPYNPGIGRDYKADAQE
jgi:hypothetical protein